MPPKSNPQGWVGRYPHFDNEPFVRATTRGFLHLPINMGSVLIRGHEATVDAAAEETEGYLVLNRDLPGEVMLRLNGGSIAQVP